MNWFSYFYLVKFIQGFFVDWGKLNFAVFSVQVECEGEGFR